MKITNIEISHHQLDLDPPFPASWDTQPRRKFPATIVRVFDDEGNVGIGSGDVMYGFEDYVNLFIGENPLDLVRHNAVLENVSFHAGRPWPLDVALWDLAGKITQQPTWKMMGGHDNKILAYASSGVHRTPEQMADMAKTLVAKGYPALKIRFGRTTLADDFEVLSAVRQAVGDKLTLMVDCNQGWRMPWDIQKPWCFEQAYEVSQELEKYNVYWMEEPLYRGDYNGMSALHERVNLKLAGGEMTRESYEFHTLIERECLDIIQPDVVCSIGMEGLRQLGHYAKERGVIFTPHTWGNGIGLLANCHLTAGSVGAPFIEFPLDPPEWSIERRDFMLQIPVDVDENGWIHLSNESGLGLVLDEDKLASTKSKQATYQ